MVALSEFLETAAAEDQDLIGTTTRKRVSKEPAASASAHQQQHRTHQTNPEQVRGYTPAEY